MRAVASDRSRLRKAASSLLNALGSGLARDEAMQGKVNQWLQGALETLMLVHTVSPVADSSRRSIVNVRRDPAISWASQSRDSSPATSRCRSN